MMICDLDNLSPESVSKTVRIPHSLITTIVVSIRLPYLDCNTALWFVYETGFVLYLHHGRKEEAEVDDGYELGEGLSTGDRSARCKLSSLRSRAEKNHILPGNVNIHRNRTVRGSDAIGLSAGRSHGSDKIAIILNIFGDVDYLKRCLCLNQH